MILIIYVYACLMSTTISPTN